MTIVAGPGGREIGRVSVRVLPDTAVFGRSLSRYLTRIERSTRLQIPAVLDQSGVAADARRLASTAEKAAAVTLPTTLDDAAAETQFEALLRRLSGRTVRLTVDLDKTTLDRIGKVGAAFGRLAGTTLVIAGLASTTASLVGLAGAAVQASGALLLLPAVGVAAAAAIGTLVIGMQGFGDALSSMDDPAKFADAIAKLAPAAAETATAIRDLRPAFTGLRLEVQQRLFAGMAETITHLATAALPVLTSGLGGVATALNTGARSFAAFLAAPQSLADTSSILDNIRAALVALAPAGVAVAQVLRDIAAVGSTFLPQLAAGFAASAQRAAEFVAAARQSGQLRSFIAGGLAALSDLFQILKNLGSIAGSVFRAFDAGGFLSGIADATAHLAAFLKTAEGSAALAALGQVAGTASRVLGGVFTEALTQLAPIMVKLAPALSQFVEQLGGALVAALQIAGPLLQQLAEFLSANATWLGPIVIGLGAFAAITAPLVSGLIALANTVRVVTAVFNLMKIALATNPFVIIAAAVAALAILIITNWSTIRDVTVGIFTAIWDFVSGIWQTITGWISDRVSDIVDAIGFLGELPGRVADWFGGVFDAATGALGDLINWVRDLPGRILDALGNLGGLLFDAGRNIIEGLLNGLKNAAGAIADFLVGLVEDAVNGVLDFLGIGSPSKLMRRIGGWTAQGFAKGIRDATPLAARAANQLADTTAFDPTRTDIGTPTNAAGSPVTVNQTILAQPDQSPWAIATATNRQLGYAMRTGGGP